MARYRVEDIDVDKLWIALGGPWGRYQLKQISSYLFICVSWVIHQLSIVFIGFRPSFHCKASVNNTTDVPGLDIRREYKECSVTTYTNTSDGMVVSEEKCASGWDYDIPKHQSFVTEWDHVCDNASLAELTQMLLIVGMMLGTFICPTMSDRYGRKPVMVFSHLILFGITLGTAFSPNYYVFVVLRILTGTVSQGALSGTTLSLETLTTDARCYEEILALTFWSTAVCVMSPIAYALRNVSWRYLQITYAVLSAWSVFQWWMVDESLRWVIANGQLKRAREIIKKACRWNKKDYETVIREAELTEIFSDLHLETIDTETREKKERSAAKKLLDGTGQTDGPLVQGDGEAFHMEVKQLSVLDIVRNRAIFKVSLIIWFIWMTDSLVYYGLYMISSDLYGDRYINFLISGLIEYPACFYEFVALNRLGRKMTCITCHGLAAIGLIVATALTYSAAGNSTMLTAATVFTLIGKMGITGAFSASYLITPELYPTNLRNSGLGVGSFMGKVGAMIAPFFRHVPKTIAWLPGAIFSLLCVLVVLLVPFLPETFGIELPQTLDELTDWYNINTFSLKIGRNKFADVIHEKRKKENIIQESQILMKKSEL